MVIESFGAVQTKSVWITLGCGREITTNMYMCHDQELLSKQNSNQLGSPGKPLVDEFLKIDHNNHQRDSKRNPNHISSTWFKPIVHHVAFTWHENLESNIFTTKKCSTLKSWNLIPPNKTDTETTVIRYINLTSSSSPGCNVCVNEHHSSQIRRKANSTTIF